MWNLIFGLLSGVPGILNGLLSYLQKRADADVQKHQIDANADVSKVNADRDVNIKVIEGRIEELKIASAQRAADLGHWSTAWMVPTVFAVCLVHFAAVVFDSVPLFGHVIGSWKIAALPGEYSSMEQYIVLASAGVVTTKSVVGRIFSK